MTSTIKIFSAFVAFVSGFALCNLNIYIGGYLAAITVPRDYFLWFGSHHIIGLLILELFTFTLPIFLISIVWIFFTSYMFHTRDLLAALWSVGGCVLASIISMANVGTGLSDLVASLQHPLFMLQFVVNEIAGPCGILVGGYLLTRLYRRRQPLGA